MGSLCSYMDSLICSCSVVSDGDARAVVVEERRYTRRGLGVDVVQGLCWSEARSTFWKRASAEIEGEV